MSYSYEITHTNSKKKAEQSRYIYKNNELDSQTFIFELILKNSSNQTQTIRKIKKSNQGVIISSDDMIKYHMIDKYLLTVIDINNIKEPIVVKDTINHMLSTNTFMNNMIYLELIEGPNNFLNINYHLL